MIRAAQGNAMMMRIAGLMSAALLVFPAGLGQDEPAQPSAGGGPSGSAQQVTQFVPGYRQADSVAVLTVHGVIDHVTLRSLERRIAQAEEEGFDAIVIDLDTPGGRVDAAMDISHLLKFDAPANTVAWVNPDAYSAGTLLALSCREIVVHPAAAWGDCAPIEVAAWGQLVSLPPAERAKLEAPLRLNVVDSARRHGYDERLVEAFISVGVELWMLEHRQTGDRIFVDRAEYATMYGEEPPTQIAPVTPRTAPTPPAATGAPPGQAPQPVAPFYRPITEGNEFEGLTEAEREELLRKRVQEGQTLPARPPLTAAEAGEWKLIGQVISDDKLLVLDAQTSVDYGLARAVVRNDEDLRAYFGALPGEEGLLRFNESWSEKMVRFLVSFWVRAILIVVLLISLFLEMAAPGTGLFGLLSLGALLLLIGAPFLAGMAQWWEILMILLGIALIGTEVFVIPGFGVAGISGVICLLIGVVGTFVSGDLDTAQGQSELITGIAATIVAFLAGGVGIWLLSRYVYEVPLLKRLILTSTTDSGRPDSSSTGLLHAMGPEQAAIAIGAVGVAETDLRPAGRARFEDRILDVVTPGGYIASGTSVRITTIGRFRIEVEEA